MSRGKARQKYLKELESEAKIGSLSFYRQQVNALACAARLFFLPLGSQYTGNRPNDLLLTWSYMWPIPGGIK